MDMIIFSKNRAFQLYTALETINKYVSGVDNIYVQFNYSEQKYLDGYIKLNNLFQNIVFIDETTHGFKTTLLALIGEIKSDNIAFDVDDVIYYNKVDLKHFSNIFSNTPNVSEFQYSFD